MRDNPNRFSVAFGRYAMALAVCVVLCGCGSSDRPETIAVRGKVTFDGGDCPTAGNVRFLPVKPADGARRRPGFATFEKDGHFVARSFEPGDGLVPGTYRVQVECWKTPPAMGKPGISHMPADFTSFELQIDADARGAVEVNYDITGSR